MRSIKIKRNQERTATTETNDLRPRDSTVSGNDPSARTHWPIEARHFQHTAVMSDQTPHMPRTRMGDLHRFEQVFGLFQYRTDHARPVMSSRRPCKRDRRISGQSSTNQSEVSNRNEPRNLYSSASRRPRKFLLAHSANIGRTSCPATACPPANNTVVAV